MNPDLIHVRPAVLSRLLRLGANVDQAMARAHVPASGGVDTARYFAFWEALGAASPPDIGIRLAAEATVHEYDLSLLAALHSPDVRTVFEKLARYKRLCGPQDLDLSFSAKEVVVSTVWLNAATPPPPRLVDAMTATLLVLLRRGSGQALVPKRLELTRERSDEATLARFFGCPLKFRASRDALVFDATILQTPFVTHNADLLRTLLPSLDARVARQRGNGFVDEVREVVAKCMSGERPTADKVAHELATSARTLQRRLQAHGTTYQAVLDETRHHTARRLLGTTRIEIAEIAFLLGFEELNSFTRAFRVWEGKTPKQWREVRGAMR
ncbi:AraC family transcriptional regulator [Trinickia diaoshuihuensis]|jgi:AraC-like DNA-binding protein|uniref:AraC family transcriptional regulator n=1 Tax=Trinickia diaoshuihuensis TaxID=2292265 RepID=UPI000E254C42|nr:AraC family transcriptional regulator [Trinickia diaoshuihuensis]